MNQASFDTWTSIFLIAAFQGCFLSFIIWKQKEENHHGKNYLTILVGLFSVMLMYYVSYWTGYNRYLNYFDGIFLTIPFSFGPIVFAYHRKLIQKDLSASYVIHFIPLALHLTWVLVLRFFLRGLFEGATIFSINNWVFNIQALHILIYAALLFFNKKELHEEQLKWQKFTKYAFLLFAIAHALYYAMVNVGKYVLILDYFISLSMSIFIYGLAYSGLRFSSIR